MSENVDRFQVIDKEEATVGIRIIYNSDETGGRYRPALPDYNPYQGKSGMIADTAGAANAASMSQTCRMIEWL